MLSSEMSTEFSESETSGKSFESVLTTLCDQAIKCKFIDVEGGEKLKKQLRDEFGTGHPPYAEGCVVERYFMLLNANELAKRAAVCQGTVSRSFLILQVNNFLISFFLLFVVQFIRVSGPKVMS